MLALIPVNQKGGVGKTTTSYNFAHYAADKGHRSGLVDADEQGDATKAMKPYEITEFTSADLFGGTPLPRPAKFGNPVLIPSDRARLIAVERSPLEDHELLENLKARLAELAPHFDYVTFDTAAANSRIANAFLAASDFAVVPSKIDSFSIGVSIEVLRRIMFIQRNFNPKLESFGIMASEFDKRQPAQVEDLKALMSTFNEYMFPKAITDRQAYREAAAAQVPVWRLKREAEPGERTVIKTEARKAGEEMHVAFAIMLDRMEKVRAA